MTETSYFWGGTVTGHATLAPYDDNEFSDVVRDLVTYDRTVECVISTIVTGFTGMLEVTNPSGTIVRLATGVALVDGKLYRNDATIDFSAPTSGQYYRVVLRKAFVAQTVTAVLLGPDGAGAPALTQNDGVTWEVPLATIYNSGGALFITDERVFINKKPLNWRQGGSGTDWNTFGSTNYAVDNLHLRIQTGASYILLEGVPPLGATVVTFPQPFVYIPIVIMSIGELIYGGSYPEAKIHLSAVSETGFTIYSRDDNASSPIKWTVNWIAIGRE